MVKANSTPGSQFCGLTPTEKRDAQRINKAIIEMKEMVGEATAEHQTTENWELILHICLKIKEKPLFYVQPAVNSIKNRLNHPDPHVVILALSVLDSCWSNSGRTVFRREISSREFINELESKCKSSVRQVGEKARQMIKKWVDNEVKEDDSLSLVRTLHETLAADGLSFESSEPKKRVVISNDPNVVTSEEEEDAFAKAIAAPLSDAPKEHGSEPQDDAVRKLMATIENAEVIAAEARRAEKEARRAAEELEWGVRRAKKELEVMKKAREEQQEIARQMEKAQRLAQLKASLPHEPADGAPGTLLISLFIPGKGQVMRRFSRSMPLSVFLTFLESEGMEPDQLGLSPGDGMDEWDPSTTLGEIGKKSTR